MTPRVITQAMLCHARRHRPDLWPKLTEAMAQGVLVIAPSHARHVVRKGDVLDFRPPPRRPRTVNAEPAPVVAMRPATVPALRGDAEHHAKAAQWWDRRSRSASIGGDRPDWAAFSRSESMADYHRARHRAVTAGSQNEAARHHREAEDHLAAARGTE